MSVVKTSLVIRWCCIPCGSGNRSRFFDQVYGLCQKSREKKHRRRRDFYDRNCILGRFINKTTKYIILLRNRKTTCLWTTRSEVSIEGHLREQLILFLLLFRWNLTLKKKKLQRVLPHVQINYNLFIFFILRISL